MKKICSRAFIRYIAVVAALVISLNALADDDDPPPPLDEDPGAPIDGGVSLLIAAGVGYGAKKVHDMRKKKQEQTKEDQQ